MNIHSSPVSAIYLLEATLASLRGSKEAEIARRRTTKDFLVGTGGAKVSSAQWELSACADFLSFIA